MTDNTLTITVSGRINSGKSAIVQSIAEHLRRLGFEPEVIPGDPGEVNRSPERLLAIIRALRERPTRIVVRQEQVLRV